MTRAGDAVWLTTLADLALILFMVTAVQLGRAEFERSREASARSPIESDAPLAIFRPTDGASGFGEWLSGQGTDRRELLTIRLTHGENDTAQRLDTGMALFDAAEAAGWQPRLMLQRGAPSGVVAVIAFDRDDLPRQDTPIQGEPR
jgi:hypothetical protein